MQTSELTGAALDWAVAKCEGYSQCVVVGRGSVRANGLLRPHRLGGIDPMLLRPTHDEWVKRCDGYPWLERQTVWEPSTAWSQGGPIIERERISLRDDGGDQWAADDSIRATVYGSTALIAAMRCYVASRLGNYVEIAEALACEQ